MPTKELSDLLLEIPGIGPKGLKKSITDFGFKEGRNDDKEFWEELKSRGNRIGIYPNPLVAIGDAAQTVRAVHRLVLSELPKDTNLVARINEQINK